MLTKCFGWAIDKHRPELGNCPVLVLGHALGNDMPKLYEHVGFDIGRLGTMVHKIDSQVLASTMGYWTGQPISLKNLVNLMGFQYHDPHTANNDTGMTVVSAVQMVLFSQFKNNQTKSLQQVVDDLEKWSESTPSNDLGGADKYCLRCNKRGHLKPRCYSKIEPCEHCLTSGELGRERIALGHETQKCLTFLKEEALAAIQARKQGF
jgi:hypothetical protein